MNFWEIIEKNKNKWNIQKICKNIEKKLSNLDLENLISFEVNLREKIFELNSSEITFLCMILTCDFEKKDWKYIFDEYVSFDFFLYFRCFLILQWEEFFEEIKSDLNNFSNFDLENSDFWWEELLYVTDNAYFKNNKNSEIWIRDKVLEKFPELDYDKALFSIYDSEKFLKKYEKLVEIICKTRIYKNRKNVRKNFLIDWLTLEEFAEKIEKDFKI